jgi:hypothetical protein
VRRRGATERHASLVNGRATLLPGGRVCPPCVLGFKLNTAVTNRSKRAILHCDLRRGVVLSSSALISFRVGCLARHGCVPGGRPTAQRMGAAAWPARR